MLKSMMRTKPPNAVPLSKLFRCHAAQGCPCCLAVKQQRTHPAYDMLHLPSGLLPFSGCPCHMAAPTALLLIAFSFTHPNKPAFWRFVLLATRSWRHSQAVRCAALLPARAVLSCHLWSALSCPVWHCITGQLPVLPASASIALHMALPCSPHPLPLQAPAMLAA